MRTPLHWVRFWDRCLAKAHTALIATGLAACGRRTVICPPLRIGGERHISLGTGVFLGANSWIEVVEAERARSRPVIEIGDEASLSGFCTISAVERVVIGAGALIARYVYIADHSHEFRSPDRPIKDQGLCKVAPVIIGAGSWIGQSAVICPGVRVGRNAVVGANSIVREDVPDFTVVAGAPARVIRRLPQTEPASA